jgi:hypothetical protein
VDILEHLDHNLEDLMDDDELGLTAEIDSYESHLDSIADEPVIEPARRVLWSGRR